MKIAMEYRLEEGFLAICRKMGNRVWFAVSVGVGSYPSKNDHYHFNNYTPPRADLLFSDLFLQKHPTPLVPQLDIAFL
jgi:hypothetical protein